VAETWRFFYAIFPPSQSLFIFAPKSCRVAWPDGMNMAWLADAEEAPSASETSSTKLPNAWAHF